MISAILGPQPNSQTKVDVFNFTHPPIAKISDAIGRLKRLEFLNLDECSLDSEIYDAIASMDKLRWLRIVGANPSDADVGRLSSIRQRVAIVIIEGERLTDECVSSLVQMQSPSALTLINTQISPNGETRLREAFPACHLALIQDRSMAPGP